MYAYLDRPVDVLGGGSGFLLTVMREWIGARRRGLCPRGMVRHRFVVAGAGAALPDFDAAMHGFDRALGRQLLIAPAACRRIGESEAVLLALWADLADGAHERALAVLRLMVPAATADMLAEAMAGVTDHLRHAGIRPGRPHSSIDMTAKKTGETDT